MMDKLSSKSTFINLLLTVCNWLSLAWPATHVNGTFIVENFPESSELCQGFMAVVQGYLEKEKDRSKI